jgi:hypothetical protein
MPSDILLNHSLAIREFPNFAAMCRYRVKMPAGKRFCLKIKKGKSIHIVFMWVMRLCYSLVVGYYSLWFLFPYLGHIQGSDWSNLPYMTHFFNTTSTESAIFPLWLTSIQKTGAVSSFKTLVGNHLTDCNMMSEAKCSVLYSTKKDDNYEQNCITAVTVPYFTKYPRYMNCNFHLFLWNKQVQIPYG